MQLTAPKESISFYRLKLSHLSLCRNIQKKLSHKWIECLRNLIRAISMPKKNWIQFCKKWLKITRLRFLKSKMTNLTEMMHLKKCLKNFPKNLRRAKKCCSYRSITTQQLRSITLKKLSCITRSMQRDTITRRFDLQFIRNSFI